MTLEGFQAIFRWALPSLLLSVVGCFFVSCIMQKGSKRTFKEVWRDQVRVLRQAESMALLLMLELAIFVLTFFVIFFIKNSKEAADFFAYAAPCAAGLVVGLGLIAKAADVRPGVDPFSILDYRFYVYSMMLIFCSLIGYLIAKFDAWVFSWVVVYCCFFCTAAYVGALSISTFNQRRWDKKSKTLTLVERLIAVGLLAVSAIFCFCVLESKAWLSAEAVEQTNSCGCEATEDKNHYQNVRYPFQRSDGGVCIFLYGIHSGSFDGCPSVLTPSLDMSSGVVPLKKKK